MLGPRARRPGMKHSLLVLASFFVVACRDNPSSTAQPLTSPREDQPAASDGITLTRVTDPSLVCMVNDRFMGSEQIAVPVEGRTYYGCCAACKDKLENNPRARTAIDPVTQQPVDKASAVIGKTAQGNVVYFESEASFGRYAKK